MKQHVSKKIYSHADRNILKKLYHLLVTTCKRTIHKKEKKNTSSTTSRSKRELMMGGRRRRCLDDTFRTFFRRRWWAPPPMDFLDKGRTRQPLSTPPYEPAAKPGHAWPTGRRGLHVMWLAIATQRNYLTRVRIRTLLTNPRICWRGQHRRPFSHRPVNIHCCKSDTRSMPRTRGTPPWA